MGGGGRSAMCLALSRELSQRRLPHEIHCLDLKGVLSSNEILRPISSNNSISDSSDEACMLATHTNPEFCQVWLVKDRIQALKLRTQSKSLSCILVDDGLEDPRLDKAYKIRLCKKNENLSIGFREIWPLGPFRSRPQDHPELFGTWREAIDAPSEASPWGPRRFHPSLQPQEIRLFCGIGDPNALKKQCETAGFTILEHKFLRDHSSHFADVLSKELLSTPIPIAITSKDAARIPPELWQHSKILILQEEIELHFSLIDLICRTSRISCSVGKDLF
jgi:tetraacyldisaccharide-1-P 4'-kinase